MTHNPNVYGYVNGKPVFSRDEFIFEHRKRGPIEDDAELIAFAEKATSGWHNAGWSHSFISFYLSDYALSEPFASLTLCTRPSTTLPKSNTRRRTSSPVRGSTRSSTKEVSSMAAKKRRRKRKKKIEASKKLAYWAASVATLSAASSLLLSAFGRDPVGELTGTIFTACVGYLITYAGKSLGEKISRNRHGLDADGNPLPDPSGDTLNNEEAKG